MNSLRWVSKPLFQYRRHLSALAVLCFGLMSAASQAMTVKPVSLKSIVESSGMIVHGIVTKVSSGTDSAIGDDLHVDDDSRVR